MGRMLWYEMPKVISELESPNPEFVCISFSATTKTHSAYLFVLSCLVPTAAVAAAVMAAAAAPTLAPPAAFAAPATLANAAIPPTNMALKATVGFTAVSILCLQFPSILDSFYWAKNQLS
ncbi:hypothetical protein ACFX11_025160 [Malus domestica]